MNPLQLLNPEYLSTADIRGLYCRPWQEYGNGGWLHISYARKYKMDVVTRGGGSQYSYFFVDAIQHNFYYPDFT